MAHEIPKRNTLRMTVSMAGLYGSATVAQSRLSQSTIAVFKDSLGNTMQKLGLIGRLGLG